MKAKDVKNMMRKSVSKKSVAYTIDLTQIEGDGSFSCPKCGTVISPEDETEEVYKILDTKIVNDELIELLITCGTCGSNIKLTGFQQSIEG
jgi:predicted RNA-binding Zn-ribbon protein involved in translation (DUF1610 family)